MASATKTAYQILGIGEQAQQKEIKDAHKKMALRSRPDKNPNDPQAKSTLQLVSEAYETLIHASRRVIYDARLRSQRGTPRLSRVQRTQWDVFDSGAEIPSWAPPPRRPTYDWASGFQKRQLGYSSYHYWHKFEGGHRPSTPDPRPSWDNNGPRPGPEPPNDYPSWDNAQENWQSYTPPSPDWDKIWVKDQQEKAE